MPDRSIPSSGPPARRNALSGPSSGTSPHRASRPTSAQHAAHVTQAPDVSAPRTSPPTADVSAPRASRPTNVAAPSFLENLVIRSGPRPPNSSRDPSTRAKPAGQNVNARPERVTNDASPAQSSSRRPNLDDPQPPEWLIGMPRSNTRPRGRAAFIGGRSVGEIEIGLNQIVKSIDACEEADPGNPPQALLAKILNAIHDIAFVPVTPQIVRNTYMLDNTYGLPRLFCPKHSKGVRYPFYVRADAAELYTKWYKGNWEVGLYRGLLEQRPENEGDGVKKESCRLDPDWPHRVRGNYFGAGQLQNGQWWPNQLCAIRDGAHSNTVAGISGKDGEGAHSIILAGNPCYPDIDEGDKIQYCGTPGSFGKMTASTTYMTLSYQKHLPVRVIRSSEAKHEYSPKKGYRYDGLYDITGSEVLNAEKAHYRFTLIRQPGQDPIRYEGLAARPTAYELEEYADILRSQNNRAIARRPKNRLE